MYFIIFITISYLLKYDYGTITRRNFKKRYKIQGLVQDHHIIPKEFKSNISFDIDSSYNIIILPNKIGKDLLNTNRPIHENGHPKYNKHVKYLFELGYTDKYILSYLKYEILNNNTEKLF